MRRTILAALLVVVAGSMLAGSGAAERTRRSRRRRAAQEAAESQADTSAKADAEAGGAAASDTAGQADAGSGAKTDSAVAAAAPPRKAAEATDDSVPAVEPVPAAASSIGGESSEPTDIVVARAAVCTSVVEREPQGSAEEFPRDVGKLCCFTHITGVEDTIEVRHEWYQGDSLVSTVVLPVRSPSWRTYSAKAIGPGTSGDWKVVVSNADNGTVLMTLQFRVQP